MAQLFGFPFRSAPRPAAPPLVLLLRLLLFCGSTSPVDGKPIGDLPPAMKRWHQHNGDHGHNDVFHIVDSNDDGIIDFQSEASRHGITEDWFAYYDEDGDDVLDVAEFMKLFRDKEFYVKADMDLPPPKGHLEPLGSHGPPNKEGVREVFYTDEDPAPISPKEFWTQHVHRHKPLVFRGVDRKSVAFEKWDEAYVREKFGWVDLKLEPAQEDRGNKNAYSDVDTDQYIPHADTRGRLNITNFFEFNKGRNMYAVSILPQAMAWDVTVPSPVVCGSRNIQADSRLIKHTNVNKAERKMTEETTSEEREALIEAAADPARKENQRKHPFPHKHPWLTHMFEANLWLANGYTRSQLHYDKENIVLCLYRGVKDFIMVDTRKEHAKMPWVRGGRYASTHDIMNSATDWVHVNPDKVDLRVHRGMADLEYDRFTLHPGDCVYMPYSYVHFVRSNQNATDPNEFQIATSYMFVPETRYDSEVCEKDILPRFEKKQDLNLPAAVFDILWYYSGKGVIPQGYPDPEHVKDDLKQTAKMHGSKLLTPKHMVRYIGEGDARIKKDKKLLKSMMKEFLSYRKDKKKKGLHVDELGWPNIPLTFWLRLSVELDQEGGLDCDEGQPYIPRTDEEEQAMENRINEWLERTSVGGGGGADTKREEL